MKSTKQILSSLTKQSHFDSLTQHTCYRKFMELLPPRFQKAVAFVYIKNRTLFIALSHPGYKMELNYNKELFKELLETLCIHAPECKNKTVDNVVLFNSKHYTLREDSSEETVPSYSELASGDFKISPDNEELEKKFLYSKELISKNIENSKVR